MAKQTLMGQIGVLEDEKVNILVSARISADDRDRGGSAGPRKDTRHVSATGILPPPKREPIGSPTSHKIRTEARTFNKSTYS